MDKFERKHAAYWKKVRTLTVPAATSPDCEVAKHTACSGDAWDKLKDQPAPCSCVCHRVRRR